ncbi:MAG: SCO family protein [Pseudomonadota bacterium]
MRATTLRGVAIGLFAAIGGAIIGTITLKSPKVTPAAPSPKSTIADGTSATAAPALPFNIGGHFKLRDQHGRTRTPGDFDGKPVFLFFGYASCEAICTTGLPRIAKASRALTSRGIATRPVMITVDPKRDTPEQMGRALAKIDADLLGLTGSPTALVEARRAFQVDAKVVYVTPDGEDVFAHGNFIYLLDATGKFITMFPPILSSDRMAEIAEKYLSRKS